MDCRKQKYGKILLLLNKPAIFAETYFVRSTEILENLYQEVIDEKLKTMLITRYIRLMEMVGQQSIPEYEKKAEKWRKRLEELEK